MGKVSREYVLGDSSNEERRGSERREAKFRTKKKKRKWELEDLHQKVLKARKTLRRNRTLNKTWESSFVKLLNNFAKKREEYDRQAKGEHCKSNKTRLSLKICDRILPRPLAGIYRNGAKGKDIRRTEKGLSVDELDNARREGDVFKLLNGGQPASENVAIAKSQNEVPKDNSVNPPIKQILQPSPSDTNCSPILGIVDGKKGRRRTCLSKDVANKNNFEKFEKQTITNDLNNIKNMRNSPIAFCKELCNVICRENYNNDNILQENPDCLKVVKSKLRSLHADTFHNQFICDAIKSGRIFDEPEIPISGSVSQFENSELNFMSPTFKENTNVQSTSAQAPLENQADNYFVGAKYSVAISGANIKFRAKNPDNMESENDVVFETPITDNLNMEAKKAPQIRAPKKSNLEADVPERNYEMHCNKNHKEVQISKNVPLEYSNNGEAEILKTFLETQGPCFSTDGMKVLPNDCLNQNYLTKYKSQYARADNLHTKKQAQSFGNLNQKAPNKGKNAKYIPAILRRCNNNYFEKDESINLDEGPANFGPNLQNVLFNASPERHVFLNNNNNSSTPDSMNNSEEVRTPTIVNALFYKSGRVSKAQFLEPRETKAKKLNLKIKKATNSEVRFENMHGNLNNNLNAQQVSDIGPCSYYGAHRHDSQNAEMAKAFVYPMKSNLCLPEGELLTNNFCKHQHNCHKMSHINHQPIVCNERSIDMEQYHQLLHENLLNNQHNYCSRNNQGNVYKIQHAKLYRVPQVENKQNRQKPRIISDKMLFKRESKQQHSRKECNENVHNNPIQRPCYVVLDKFQNLSNKHRTQHFENNQIPQNLGPEFLTSRPVSFQEGGAGILNGVQNLQILSVDEPENSNSDFENLDDEKKYGPPDFVCGSLAQPVKYFAYENGLVSKKIPIFLQNEGSSVDDVVLDSKRCCYMQCARKAGPKILVEPKSEQNMIHLKPRDLSHSNLRFEKYSRSKNVSCHPSMYEAHFSKTEQNDIVNSERGPSCDSWKRKMWREINWNEVPRRSNFECLCDGCTKGQIVYSKNK